jgi:hypothetical protein
MTQPMQCGRLARHGLYHHAWNGIIRNGIIQNGYNIMSLHLPIVILDGNPWGLKMISGTIPDSVKGMFSMGHFWLWGKKNFMTYEKRIIL